MILDLSNKFEADKATMRLDKMIEKGKVVVLKEKRMKKTIQQIKYLHVLFALYGSETGYTKEESKKVLKRQWGKMSYMKRNESFLYSCADLSKEKMQFFIDWIITLAAHQGIRLPSSEEYLENQHAIDKEIERNNKYLNQ